MESNRSSVHAHLQTQSTYNTIYSHSETAKQSNKKEDPPRRLTVMSEAMSEAMSETG